MAVLARPRLFQLDRIPQFIAGMSLGRDVNLLVASNLLWGVGTGFFTYLLPLYIADLGAEPAQIGFALALTSIVQALVYIPAGLLADRLGRKPLMVTGWAMGPAAMVVFTVAQSWEYLLVGIALLAAVAWSAPAYHSYIAAATGAREMAHVYVLMFVGVTAGAALSAPVGGWLADTVGLRWPFAGAFFAFFVSTCLVAAIRPQPRYRPPPAEVVAVPAPAARWRPRRLRLRWGALPTIWSRQLATALALTGGLMFAANLGQPFAPNLLVEQREFSSVDIGRFGSVSALGGAAFALALGRLQRRRGPQWALPVAILGLLLYALLLLLAHHPALATLAYLVRGIFQILPSLAVSIIAGVLTQGNQGGSDRAAAAGPSSGGMGLGFALYNTANALALTLSTYAAGWLYGWSAPLPFVASAALLVLALWVVPWLASQVAPKVPTSTVGG